MLRHKPPKTRGLKQQSIPHHDSVGGLGSAPGGLAVVTCVAAFRGELSWG